MFVLRTTVALALPRPTFSHTCLRSTSNPSRLWLNQYLNGETSSENLRGRKVLPWIDSKQSPWTYDCLPEDGGQDRPSNSLELPLLVRPEVFSQVFKCFENFQGLEPIQTKCKENTRDGAVNILKFFKRFECTAWIKKRGGGDGRKFRLWMVLRCLQTASLYIISFEPLDNSEWSDGLVLLFLFYRWGNWRFCSLDNLPRVLQLTRGCKVPAQRSSRCIMLLHNWGQFPGRNQKCPSKEYTDDGLEMQTIFYIFLSLMNNTSGMSLIFSQNGFNFSL